MDRRSKLWAYGLGVDAASESPQRLSAKEIVKLAPFKPESQHYFYWVRGFRSLPLEPSDPTPGRLRKGNKRGGMYLTEREWANRRSG